MSLVNEVYNVKSKGALHKKSQHLVKTMLQILFPNEDVFEEYNHPDLVSSNGYILELDFFYPKLNMALEYQVFNSSDVLLNSKRGHNIIELWLLFIIKLSLMNGNKLTNRKLPCVKKWVSLCKQTFVYFRNYFH
jgi:hypothetical protein